MLAHARRYNAPIKDHSHYIYPAISLGLPRPGLENELSGLALHCRTYARHALDVQLVSDRTQFSLVFYVIL